MANGLPVAASDLPGVAWAKESPGVVMFPSDDTGALADAVIRILSWSPPELATRAAANREFIAFRYPISNWVDGTLGLYSQALGGRGRGADE